MWTQTGRPSGPKAVTSIKPGILLVSRFMTIGFFASNVRTCVLLQHQASFLYDPAHTQSSFRLFSHADTGGSTNQGDFALDYITVTSSTPSPSPYPTLPPSPPTPFPTFTGSAGSYTSSFESYKGDGDVSGDGLWNTGVNFNQWSVHSGSTKSGTTGPDSAYDGSYYLCTYYVGSSKSLLGSLPGLCMNPHRLRDDQQS